MGERMGERTGEDPLRSRAPHPPHTSHGDQCNRRHSSHVSQYAYDRTGSAPSPHSEIAISQDARPKREGGVVPTLRTATRGCTRCKLELYLLKRVIASRRSVITLSATQTHVGIGRHDRDATSDTYYRRRVVPSYRRRKAKGAVALGRVGCERRVSPRIRGPSPRFACGGHPQRPLPQG